MGSLLELHTRAVERFGHLVHQVGPDQWDAPTPDDEWDVRALVHHLVVELLWVPPLLDGRTIDDVGDAFDGDQLGDDPVGAYDRAARPALSAWRSDGALARTVHLSYGDVGGEHYCRQMTSDFTIHGWDLARGIGADDTIPTDLAQLVYDDTAPRAGELAGSGLFDPPVDVPADADLQTRLLAMFGRHA